jgi:DNA-binding PadR family transcriptional regulator
VSPVFRHGRLRLYLLKLLDEGPRHGYEVIRLLQDRFMGVYAPSPGTIYPRLARLEEEGLVTHDEIDGRKVYRITDKGREEINHRLDDLAELEEEITESVRDIARSVSRDVRDTVRSLREELTWAARDVRREGREETRRAARERAQQIREDVRQSARQAREEFRQVRRPPDGDAGTGAGTGAKGAADADQDAGRERAGRGQQQDRFRSRLGWDRGQWADWAASQDWRGWAERAERASWAAWRERAEPGTWAGWDRPSGRGGRSEMRMFRDLERMAIDFARELRSAARQGSRGPLGEEALRDLRGILEDTLNRVRDEVFGRPSPTASDQEGSQKDQ